MTLDDRPVITEVLGQRRTFRGIPTKAMRVAQVTATSSALGVTTTVRLPLPPWEGDAKEDAD